MGKVNYCDYCDVFLTHDSSSVRKAHNAGRNHLTNVKDYYSSLGHDKAQDLIDQITKMYESGQKMEGRVGIIQDLGALMGGANGGGGGGGGMRPPMGGMGGGIGMGQNNPPMRFGNGPPSFQPQGFNQGPPGGFNAPPQGFRPPPGMPAAPAGFQPPPGFAPPQQFGLNPAQGRGNLPALVNGMDPGRARQLGLM